MKKYLVRFVIWITYPLWSKVIARVLEHAYDRGFLSSDQLLAVDTFFTAEKISEILWGKK